MGPIEVVDVGANPLSPPPYAQLLKAGRCRIWGFEPNESAFNKLQESKGPCENYLPYAVGNGETGKFHSVHPSGLSSTLDLSKRGLSYLGHWENALDRVVTVDTTTRRLDDMGEVPKIDLLKIDIQGGELAVFKGGRRKLDNAVAIITEVRYSELYVNEPMFGGVDLELRDQGFIFHKFFGIKRMAIRSSQFDRLNVGANRNQSIDGDVMYICNMMEPERISSGQLKKLAILAHEVSRSFDLVARCLDLLVDRGEIPETSPSDYVDRLPAGFTRTPQT